MDNGSSQTDKDSSQITIETHTGSSESQACALPPSTSSHPRHTMESFEGFPMFAGFLPELPFTPIVNSCTANNGDILVPLDCGCGRKRLLKYYNALTPSSLNVRTPPQFVTVELTRVCCREGFFNAREVICYILKKSINIITLASLNIYMSDL